MILVDTSVWIDFFRAKSGRPHPLAELLGGRNRVCLCGLIRQEILQGIHQPKELTATTRMLDLLPFLPTTTATDDHAAEIFRVATRHGLNMPTVDATIAAIALQHNVSLYTRDHRHLCALAELVPLRLYDEKA